MRMCHRKVRRPIAGELLTITFLVFVATVCNSAAEAQTWEQEVTADSPLSWWRLDEPVGSQVFVDSGSVGLDLNARTGIVLPGDFNENTRVDGADFSIWQRGFGTAMGATHGDGDANGDGAVDGFDLAAWKADYGKIAEIAAGLPSLPGIGSAVDTTRGHLQALDDVKGGELAISTRQGSTPVSEFTYEAWVKVTNDVDPVFASIGGNSVNAAADGDPPDQYGARICASTDLGRFCGGLTGVRLENQSGEILFENGTSESQPTKDLHFDGGEFGVPPEERLDVVADQWYYIAAQWSENGFIDFGQPDGFIPQAKFIGHVYWRDDQGVDHELHRDHGSGFDFGQIRIPDPGDGLLGFAVGAQLITGAFNFPGLISEFAVYGEALTDERLEAHFLAGLGAPLSSLSVPEPSALALLAAGSLVVGLGRRAITQLK